ncbi:MAG: hypothetical protein JKY42_09335 [Flavobacteriales bacterium]|nr:hypothetical protein [Flavobacteriales bacterium]
MEIIRKQLIYCPDGSLDWAQTHAMNPTVDVLSEEIIRVYFSSLDANKIGRIGYVEVNAKNPSEIIHVSDKPVLDIGIDGTFDDNGVVPSSIITYKGTKYLYYFGFQMVQKVRFLIYSGVAISTDNGKTFTRDSEVPVLDRNKIDKYICSLPHVLEDKKKFKIWYSGVNEWTEVNGKELPLGNIRYIESSEPNTFRASKIHRCLEPLKDEFSLSRAFVYKRNEVYHMIFSRRMRATDKYKLGYAQSLDGIEWIRNDNNLQISPSKSKWDDQMMCYTSLIDIQGRQLLFYNGNGFGETGFGYAVVKD